ncbi:hypothetical protein AGMMS50267_09960 [Spirochaetia bacterium]|nr:hypothetical protein AGMMS50267_09960 [Spirochaetia bacterium]
MVNSSKIMLIVTLLFFVLCPVSLFAQSSTKRSPGTGARVGTGVRRANTGPQDTVWVKEQKLNGLRVHTILGGFNLKYRHDPEQVYSDAIGALFARTERYYDGTSMGVGLHFTPPKLGIFILNAVVTNDRLAAGVGVAAPIPAGGNMAFTPWVTIDLAYVNKEAVPLVETGIEFNYKKFVAGLEAGFFNVFSGNPDGWFAISYGITLGMKIK